MEDYVFVKDPPDDYQCMICSKVLTEPHVTDCCGQHFCQVCLENWFAGQHGKKICPHCRSESFSHVRYLPLKRKINALQVYCSYRKDGCYKVTTVGELNSHKGVCGFAKVSCTQGCGLLVLRKDLGEHCSKLCLKRKVECRFCGNVGRFETMRREHVAICPDYPIACPNGCNEGSGIKRKDLKKHTEVCPLEQVHCDFHEVGCDVCILRKDLEAHLDSNTQLHLKKMMSCCSQLTKEQIKLKDECKQLSSQVEMLTLSEPVKLSEKNSSFTFNIPSSDGWISPPFYILDGYKFCIKHKCGNKASLLLLKGERDGQFKRLVDLEYTIEMHFNYFNRRKSVEPAMLQLPLRTIQESAAIGRLYAVQQNKELATMTVPYNACGTGNVTVKLVKKCMYKLASELPKGARIKDPPLTHQHQTSVDLWIKCCPYCGAEIFRNTTYCPFCGKQHAPGPVL